MTALQQKVTANYIVLCMASIADFIGSRLLINKFGFAVEANPILRIPMQTTHSIWLMLAIKVFTLLFVGSVLYFGNKKDVLRAYYAPLLLITVIQVAVAAYVIAICMRVL